MEAKMSRGRDGVSLPPIEATLEEMAKGYF